MPAETSLPLGSEFDPSSMYDDNSGHVWCGTAPHVWGPVPEAPPPPIPEEAPPAYMDDP